MPVIKFIPGLEIEFVPVYLFTFFAILLENGQFTANLFSWDICANNRMFEKL